MNTTHKCCYGHTESQFSLRSVFNYCSLLFLMLVLTSGSWFIQSVSAQDPSGTLQLVGPDKDPFPGDEFVVSVEILNPQNLSVFTIEIEYPNVFDYKSFAPAEGQFDANDLTLGREIGLVGNRIKRQFHLGINYEGANPVFVTQGTLFTITFAAEETAVFGNYPVKIVDTTHLQDAGGTVTELASNELPSVIVPVRGPMQGTVSLVPTSRTERVGETGFIDIVLKERSRAHRYEITIDPSENIGALTVSYNSDDSNGTAITNHTAGAPITISANLWLPNDPMDNYDFDLTHSDPIVATLFFTPTAIGEGSFDITEAKIFNADDTELTLSNPDTLTFTIAAGKTNVVYRDTGVGPTPIIEVDDRTKDGPFEIKIYFQSKNYIEHQLRRLENGEVVKVVATFQFQRGVYGFGRDEIEIGGDAGASVTTRLWEADGAGGYKARINPTETGPREVTIQIPAGVINEVGTHLPNVASEVVTVSTSLTHPPWDVDENGIVQENDADLVEAALGQGMEIIGDFTLYVPNIENRRTDVNGDRYVNQADVDLVRMHITDNVGAEGSGGVSGQAEETRQARSITPEPDASVWMPDKNLRKEVRKKFGIRNDSELTQARMSHLTSLGFRNDKISDITGLEYAVNLTSLVIRKTQVSDLTPLKDLTALRSLKLVDNGISNVTPLGGLTDLTFLNISGNTINDLTAIGNLTELTELWATDNNIRDITVLVGLTKLRKLRLRGNSILDTSPIYPLTQDILRSVDISVSEYPPWDINEDGSVDATDTALVTAALGQSGRRIVDDRTDVNGDDTVDNIDLMLVTDNLDDDGAAPSRVSVFDLLDRETLENLDRKVLEVYLNTLRAESDGSQKYQQAIAMLERILAAMRPTETLLLANYPNPFNPETWIPYHLATATDVVITIYDTQGVIVRRLDLGYQPEGYYTSVSRAAHWDGRNEFGERVASGLYFYRLQVDSASHLRKMVILK